MTHDSVDYRSLIRAQGYRMTPQREIILDAVCAGHGHTSFDEINARVQTAASAIDTSTVYRTLDFLCDVGLVNCALVEGQRMYEIAVGQPAHHHLICERCGAELTIEHGLIQRLFDAIQAEYGFSVQQEHLVLHGLCADCRAAQAQQMP